MATIPGITSFPEKGVMKITWTSVTENDTFGAVQCGMKYPNRNVQVIGTFGSATVLFKGSNDGTNYATLTTHDGSNWTSTGLRSIVQTTQYVQPTHSGGTSESVTVIAYCSEA